MRPFSTPVFRLVPRPFVILFCFLLSGLFCLHAPHAAQAKQEIGRVIALSGGVQAVLDGQSRALGLKDPVFTHDTLQTASDGKLQVIFNDDTTLNMGNNTVLEMRDFNDQGPKPTFKAHMPEGLARVITGRIVEKNAEGFAFSTPDATIAIRGTIIGVQVVPGQSTRSGTLTNVSLFNSMGKTVSGNGRTIGEGMTAVFADGRFQRQQPLAPDTRQLFNDGLFIALYPVSGSGEYLEDGSIATAAALTDDAATDLTTAFSPTQTLADGLTGTPGEATVSGSLFSGIQDIGTFSFDVNLTSGEARNASMSGGVAGGMSFQLSGGYGGVNGHSFLIDNGFSGSVETPMLIIRTFSDVAGDIASISASAMPQLNTPFDGHYLVELMGGIEGRLDGAATGTVAPK